MGIPRVRTALPKGRRTSYMETRVPSAIIASANSLHMTETDRAPIVSSIMLGATTLATKVS